MSVRSRDQIKNHSKHHDRSNEFECTMIYQQLMMEGENDLVLLHQVRKKMETDQVPESDLHPVPEDDDLNATLIEVMTDVEVLLDGSSVVDVFAVSSARRKRVEVNERKTTESDRNLFRKVKELELQQWLDQRGVRFGQEKFVNQGRIMRAKAENNHHRQFKIC